MKFNLRMNFYQFRKKIVDEYCFKVDEFLFIDEILFID